MRLDDPDLVRREYASEHGLAARARVYTRGSEGADARQVVFDAVAEVRPRRVLEVGCGQGELSERFLRELDADVVALDVSPRMVALARERGVDARLGDVQELPFGDQEFDCAVAAWMLYHVPDLDRGLSELARVLRPGGRLVAATNGRDHLKQLWERVGRDRPAEEPVFRGDNGELVLRRHFAVVERRDVRGTVLFPDRSAARAYVASSIRHKHLAERVPELAAPLRATRSAVVFVAREQR